jgi:hypothetical protein
VTTTTQHMQALARANEVRGRNASFRRTVAAMPSRAGAELVADVVETDYEHETLGTLPMDRLLMTVSGLGEHKTARCLAAAGVGSHHKRLRDLTPRQRAAVAAQLRLWALGYRA